MARFPVIAPAWAGATLIAMAGLAGCANAEPDPASTPAPRSASIATTTPARAPVSSPTPTPPPPPAPAPKFAYSGELTQGGWLRGKVPPGTVSATLGDEKLALAGDGSFFAGIDRDAPGEIALTAQLSDGRSHSEPIAIAPRAWQIERVNVSRTGGRTSEAFWKIREPEWNAIQDARARRTGADGWRQQFAWPVEGRISGRFGRQRIYRGEPGSYHSGIDIAPGNGVPFVAPADGVVVLARTGFSLEGGLIIIDHGMGLNSAFLHASKVAVEEGQSIRQGDYVGNVGASGRATGPHLHWSIKWNDARLDPLLLAGPMN